MVAPINTKIHKCELKGLYVYDSCVREILDMVSVAKVFKDVSIVYVQLAQLEQAITEFKFDFIVLPFCRPQFFEICRYLNTLGVSIFVFDNEGGVYESARSYFEKLDKNTAKFVDEFWLWGSELVDTFHKHGYQTRITGRPRFSLIYQYRQFLTEEFQHTLPLLINTSYSVCAPRYLSLSEEQKVWIKNGENTERLKTLIDQQKTFRNELLKQLRETSMSVLVRVHPFEDPTAYIEIAKEKDNIIVSSSLLAITDILKSKAIAQRGCTTAIEAALLGKLVFKLDFGVYPLSLPQVEGVHQEYIQSISRPIKTDFQQSNNLDISNYIDYRIIFNKALENIVDSLKSANGVPKRFQKSKIRYGYYRYTGAIGLLKFITRMILDYPINIPFFNQSSLLKESSNLEKLTKLQILNEQKGYFTINSRIIEMPWTNILKLLIKDFEDL